MSALDMLREGRERVARGWTQGTYARDRDGRKAYAWAPEACAWCALGAMRVSGHFGAEYDAARALLERFTPAALAVSSFNDASTTTQADVLALYDRAIAAAEAT